MMTGLLLFLGESFRSGGQTSRIRGRMDSFKGQMTATASHLKLLQTLGNVDAFLGTYETPFDIILLSAYEKYLVGHLILPQPIGLTNLFQMSLSSIQTDKYDYVCFVRVDLFLKPRFFTLFNPARFNTILYPSICWYRDCRTKRRHPRVNDMMVFVPKRLFRALPNIEINHDSWQTLVEKTNLTYADIDTLLNTFHDSDSQKDYNPIYYIVNRPICTTFHSPNKYFNKHEINKHMFKTLSLHYL